MNRFLRGLVALGLGFGLTLLAITLQQASGSERQPKGTPLGTVDMTGYCEARFGERAKAIHPDPGAFGWHCWVSVNGVLKSHEIDLDEACTLQYGSPAYAELISVDDPYGWLCKRGPK